MEPQAMARRLSELADSKGAMEIVALDMRGLVSYTDFLVVCTARNERQAKAIGDEVGLRLKRDEALLPRQVEGGPAGGWTVIDYLDCVLHIFTPEARDRYRLEQLWEDAPRLQLGLAGEAVEGRAARA
jgi:ribosome-associated protein